MSRKWSKRSLTRCQPQMLRQQPERTHRQYLHSLPHCVIHLLYGTCLITLPHCVIHLLYWTCFITLTGWKTSVKDACFIVFRKGGQYSWPATLADIGGGGGVPDYLSWIFPFYYVIVKTLRDNWFLMFNSLWKLFCRLGMSAQQETDSKSWSRWACPSEC